MPTADGAHGQHRSPGSLPSPLAPCSRWHRVLPGHQRELSHSRRWLSSPLPECPARDDVLSVATELGSNALEHTASGQYGGWFAVEFARHQSTVQVAVTGERPRKCAMNGTADAMARDGLEDNPVTGPARGCPAARVIAARAGHGWSLLGSGVVAFEGTGVLLLGRSVIESGHTTRQAGAGGVSRAGRARTVTPAPAGRARGGGLRRPGLARAGAALAASPSRTESGLRWRIPRERNDAGRGRCWRPRLPAWSLALGTSLRAVPAPLAKGRGPLRLLIPARSDVTRSTVTTARRPGCGRGRFAEGGAGTAASGSVTLRCLARSGVEPGSGAALPQRGLRMTGEWLWQDFLALGPLPGAVPCARLHTRLVLAEWGLARLAESAEVVVSELVTNAVAATARLGWIPAPPVRLWLLADSSQVLIAVWDANPHLPARGEVDELAESGRGLLLVETLASYWDAYPTPRWRESRPRAMRNQPASKWMSEQMNSQTVDPASSGQASSARGQADPDREAGTPGGALIGLLRELTVRGVEPAGMSLSRLGGTLILPGGLAIRYGCGWLGWPTGRVSQRGRPLHTVHGAHDVAGAARRLARTPAASAVAGRPRPHWGRPDMYRDEQLLLALHNELSGRGVRSVLDTGGIRPRLRIHCPGEQPSCAFDNNVIAAALADQWMFCWPWAEPIGLASQPAQAATAIIEALGLRAGGPAPTGPPTLPPGVTSLAAQRTRRPEQAGETPPAQARQPQTRQPPVHPAPAGGARQHRSVN